MHVTKYNPTAKSMPATQPTCSTQSLCTTPPPCANQCLCTVQPPCTNQCLCTIQPPCTDQCLYTTQSMSTIQCVHAPRSVCTIHSACRTQSMCTIEAAYNTQPMCPPKSPKYIIITGLGKKCVALKSQVSTYESLISFIRASFKFPGTYDCLRCKTSPPPIVIQTCDLIVCEGCFVDIQPDVWATIIADIDNIQVSIAKCKA
ncbi:hypothetical protein ARMGADRAFT_1163741 [Armillaria gallica]|uniref:Uncharacterized protein n=1 Tax=Armillaria gallica TaxID=47427 RepID=A0A2H3DU72_ARMGA|nr:hypothetical protein ARMGADRAFT_1163741 [Armillaria gallica]